MSLTRKSIRDALVELLMDETDAEDRVFANRVRPIFKSGLPAILIQTRTEAVEVFAESGPREYERRLQVDIEIMADANSLCDDVLDTLGAQVEAKLFEDHTLGEIVHDVNLKSCELTLNGEGDNIAGSLVLGYEITYHSIPANDADNLEFLERVDVEYDLAEGTSATNPVDTITGLGDE